MSEQLPTDTLSYRERFPEALTDPNKKVLALNMFAPLKAEGRNLECLIGHCEAAFAPTDFHEMHRRLRLFRGYFRSCVTLNGNTLEYGRTILKNLPADYYELTAKSTRFTWGKTRAESTPADELLDAFKLKPEEYREAEIVVVPPHGTQLAPIVRATEQKLGITPHFAWFEIIEYDYPDEHWKLETYRPGMTNRLGAHGGSI